MTTGNQIEADRRLDALARVPMALDVFVVRSLRDQCIAAGSCFFFKQRIEGRRKVSLPELDGRQWCEQPPIAVAVTPGEGA